MHAWTPDLVRALLRAAGDVERRLPAAGLRPAGIRGGYPRLLADLATDADTRIWRRGRIPHGWPEPIYGVTPDEPVSAGRLRPPVPTAQEVSLLDLSDGLILAVADAHDRLVLLGLRAGVPALAVGAALARAGGKAVSARTVQRWQVRVCALVCARLARTPVPAGMRSLAS